MSFKDLLSKMKKFFYVKPKKDICTMTDEELIAEYRLMYNSICVLNSDTSKSDMFRYAVMSDELNTRRYQIIGGACGVNIVKRGNPI